MLNDRKSSLVPWKSSYSGNVNGSHLLSLKTLDAKPVYTEEELQRFEAELRDKEEELKRRAETLRQEQELLKERGKALEAQRREYQQVSDVPSLKSCSVGVKPNMCP